MRYLVTKKSACKSIDTNGVSLSLHIFMDSGGIDAYDILEATELSADYGEFAIGSGWQATDIIGRIENARKLKILNEDGDALYEMHDAKCLWIRQFENDNRFGYMMRLDWTLSEI